MKLITKGYWDYIDNLMDEGLFAMTVGFGVLLTNHILWLGIKWSGLV